MPMVRPLRIYKHTFTHGTAAPIYITRLGETPCVAKRKAFVGLEHELAASPTLPRNGWRLFKQQDVTALVTRTPGATGG